MVPLESLDTVSYLHSIATMVVSLAVSTEYTNVTDRQPVSQTPAARQEVGPRIKSQMMLYLKMG